MTKGIKSVFYFDDKNLTSSTPFYIKDKLVIKMYLGDTLVYRSIKDKATNK